MGLLDYLAQYAPSYPQVQGALQSAREGFVDPSASGAVSAAMNALPIGRLMPGIRAYHGSPYNFDRFDMSKIGTGEGAQSYGHGLYFAENEKVAQGYRDGLSGRFPGAPTGRGSYAVGENLVPPGQSGHRALDTAQDIDALLGHTKFGADPRMVDYIRGNIERRIAQHEATPEQYRAGSAWDDMDALAKFYSSHVKSVRPESIRELGKGSMYEVNINARPEQFLDWDKPLSQQATASQVGPIVDRMRGASGLTERQLGADPMGEQIYSAFNSPFVRRELSGSSSGFSDKSNASAALRDAGIPGIKYLDQGSRGQGQGTSNYVLFDDKLVDILRKYGLAGMIPFAGAAAPYFSDQPLPIPQQQAPTL